MHDPELVDVFNRFLELRSEDADAFVSARILRHADYDEEKLCAPGTIVFNLMAADFIRGLIGEVNRFLINTNHAHCWIRATEHLHEHKQLGIRLEFAEPLLELSVGRPYSIRNQFIFAAAKLMHEAIKVKTSSWQDTLAEDRKINFDALPPFGVHWNKYPSFEKDLKKLSSNSFETITGNFRHVLQHRYRVQFGRGLTPYFDRIVTSSSVTKVYKMLPPLDFSTLVPALYEQHERAVEVFKSFWDLLREMSDVVNANTD